jgi:hypothetical protein
VLLDSVVLGRKLGLLELNVVLIRPRRIVRRGHVYTRAMVTGTVLPREMHGKRSINVASLKTKPLRRKSVDPGARPVLELTVRRGKPTIGR